MAKYPKAINKEEVGKYPALVKSGGGYFYDEVLEYRVWIYSPNEEDHFYPFEDFESAKDFELKTKYAQEPLVLILQKEYIDEPEKGNLLKIKEERITEWQVEWLENSKRTENNLDEFIQENKI